MADEDKDSKTEEPTEKRLSKAHEEGEVLQSQEVKTAGQLLGIAVVVWLVAPFAMSRLSSYLSGFLVNAHSIRIVSESDLADVIIDASLRVGAVVGVVVAILLVFGLTATISQTGVNFALEKLAMDLERINPVAGLKRMLSVNSLVELLKNVAKLGVVVTLCYMILMPRVNDLPLLVTMEIGPILDFLHGVIVKLLLFVAGLVAIIAAADWAFQRHAFFKKLRMTKQELKDENKQSEGDPMVRSRLRAIRMARARQRMMAAVPKADVVVTNPTHYACALKYDADKMNAPVMVAKGRDFVAQTIREVAQDNGVPVVENPPLARALYATVEIDREIPPDHYKAVAEVISYVMRLREKKRRR